MARRSGTPWSMLLLLLFNPFALPSAAKQARRVQAMIVGTTGWTMAIGLSFAVRSSGDHAYFARHWWHDFVHEGSPAMVLVGTVIGTVMLWGMLLTHGWRRIETCFALVALSSLPLIVPMNIAAGCGAIDHSLRWRFPDPIGNRLIRYAIELAGSGYCLLLIATLWACLLGFPLVREIRALRWHRRLCCVECGYDLRGSAPTGATTCPECGAAIEYNS